MSLLTFNFPYHQCQDVYPDNGGGIQFGNGYSFATRPRGPDQRKFVLQFPAMWVYESSPGVLDYTKNEVRNLMALDNFYRQVRLFDTFYYPHPRRGTLICRFGKPLTLPKVLPRADGFTEPFEVELIEVPLVSQDPTGYSIEANKVIDQFTAPPTEARKALIASTIDRLMTVQLWDKLDALFILAAANQQGAQINWKVPFPNVAMTKVGNPVFTVDRGFRGTNSTTGDYLQGPTFFKQPRFTQNNASGFCWVLNNTTGTYPAAGNEFDGFAINPRTTGNKIDFEICNGGLNAGPANTDSRGFYALSRTSSSTVKVYKDGNLLNTYTSGVDSTAMNTNTLFRFFNNGTSVGSSDHQVALGGYGMSLSDDNVAALYGIFKDYLTGVGAI